MSPPNTGSIDEIGPFWTEEQIIALVRRIQNASPATSLPCDVIADTNLYVHHPSNLPDGIWYVVYFEDPKQSEVGFWKIKGDPIQIYSDSYITGCRTTLEYYEGRPPKGVRTDWVMQEYSISGSTDAKGGRSLCRVFLADQHGESKKPDLPQANEDKLLENNKLQGEIERIQAMLPYQGDNHFHVDYFSDGDFLELDDLVDPPTSSSSSGNSSCVTPSSAMYFDPGALLKQLGTDLSSNRYALCRPNDMVLTVVPQGSPTSGTGNISTAKVEVSEAALAIESKQPEKKPTPEETTPPPPPPSVQDTGASTSRQMSRGNKGKKAHRGKTIMKFLCFMGF